MDPLSGLRAWIAPLALALLALAGAATVLATGPLAASPAALVAALFGQGPPDAELALTLRGPRLLAAMTCGAACSCCRRSPSAGSIDRPR